MKLILCLDDRDGRTFNQRRQSRDRVLCEDVMHMVAESGGKLYLPAYSAPLFEGMSGAPICVCEDYLTCAGQEDFCFCERESVAPYRERVDTLILYRWNRHYPSDGRTELNLNEWRCTSVQEFAGNSHEKITKEIRVKIP